ncbi:hypothetical protein KU306_16580 (plasmid) [Haloferax larsenii]|uniref:4 TMS phage holin, superfamily IV n=1 Tax=Haloferax larsenii TaxID=302484 RepID=A0ABY5RJ37_HALLR|nr:hypothetical protein [Haloferax larsenii]UVE51943.1 hypothetical protein KU306_16580 [Haloferax larsenii]
MYEEDDLSTEISDTRQSYAPIGLVIRTLAIVVLGILLAVGLLADGRVQIIALALMCVWLLLGFLLLGVVQAHKTGYLSHHVVFTAVLLIGSGTATMVWEVTNGVVSSTFTVVLSLGSWIATLWLGSRLIYGGSFDHVLDHISGANR